jgi:hypothetical protein
MILIIPFYTFKLRHFNYIHLIRFPIFQLFRLCNSPVRSFFVHLLSFVLIVTESFLSKTKLGFRASFLPLPLRCIVFIVFIVFNLMILILILKRKMMTKMTILSCLITIWLSLLKIFSFFI